MIKADEWRGGGERKRRDRPDERREHQGARRAFWKAEHHFERDEQPNPEIRDGREPDERRHDEAQ